MPSALACCSCPLLQNPKLPHRAHGEVGISAVGMITTLATSQELQCSSSTPTQPRLLAMQAGGGWEVPQEHQETPGTGTPLSWDRLIRAGAALDAKGKSCLWSYPARCWAGLQGAGAAHIQVQTSAEVQAQSHEGWGWITALPMSSPSHVLSPSPAAVPGSEAVLLPSPPSRSTHKVPTTPKKLWLQHPHKSLVTENIY